MAAPHPTRPRFEVAAIGEVRTDTPDAEIGRRRRTLESAVRVYDEFVDGLDGLETYSHLIVLFWMAQAPPCETLRARSHRDPEGPLRGILALRGRQRPNPIGLAVVDLIAREGAVLRVRRLDAYDGTPVIDIKPYDHYDVFPDLRVPAWSNSAPRGDRDDSRERGCR
jgi:tRNA-Thr(GGU) m(6)t(6)A37 methyltransferase TsaA